MRSAPTLVCELSRSRLELAVLAGLALAALAAPILAPIQPAARAALIAGALLATAAALAAIRRRDWTSLTLRGDGGATLRRAGGAEWIASLVDGAVLGPLVVLTLRGPDGRMTRLPLYPDAVDRETRRRLRVLLRYGWRAEPPGAIR